MGASARLDLDVGAGVNEIQLDVTVNGILRTETSTYAGFLEADLEISGGQVVGFELTGGEVAASDVVFDFGFPNVFAQTVEFEDLRALPLSPNGKENLAVAGQLTASEHVFLFNDGCLLTVGDFSNTKALVSEDPFVAGGTGSGAVILSGVQSVFSSVNGLLIGASYEVGVSLPLDSTTSTNELGIAYQQVTTGTVTASGVVVDYVHPFYEWAALNAPDAGTALSFEADANGDGFGDGLAWALGFEAGSAGQGIEVSYDESGEEFLIHFPEVTRVEIELEEAEDLDFSSPTVMMIPAGTAGPLAVSMAGRSKGFVRLVAELN
ncbi:MAG: hypothetical protein AAGC74_01535 [Verrucomicrobiota bacterium]